MTGNLWRLVLSPPAEGAVNMAIDHALLESVAEGASPPTLRLYAWDPPCLSLGYAQPAEDVDPHALAQRGWTWVRRPTGGRAILHTDELTYAVVGPEGHPDLAGGVLASYRRLSQGLLAGLRRLGLPASVQAQADLPEGLKHNPACFEVPSTYEITVDGRKLIGSAQVRRRRAVLQHGAIPLEGDIGRIALVLNLGHPEARQKAALRVRQRATTVSAVLGRPVSWQEAAEALAEGFREALGWDLMRGALTDAERARVEALLRKVYRTPAWNARA